MIVDNPPKKRQENTTAKKMTKWLDLRNLFFTAENVKNYLTLTPFFDKIKVMCIILFLKKGDHV